MFTFSDSSAVVAADRISYGWAFVLVSVSVFIGYVNSSRLSEGNSSCVRLIWITTKIGKGKLAGNPLNKLQIAWIPPAEAPSVFGLGYSPWAGAGMVSLVHDASGMFAICNPSGSFEEVTRFKDLGIRLQSRHFLSWHERRLFQSAWRHKILDTRSGLNSHASITRTALMDSTTSQMGGPETSRSQDVMGMPAKSVITKGELYAE